MESRQIDNELLIPEVGRLIEEGHTVRMTVRGRSMRPFIEDGRDKVILAKADNLRVGDVVLAKTLEKSYVIHRLTEMDAATGQCILRGDGNLDLEHCHKDDILAKVTDILRKKKDKHYSLNGTTWKTYSWLWTHLRPIRRYLLAIYRRLPWKRVPRPPKGEERLEVSG